MISLVLWLGLPLKGLFIETGPANLAFEVPGLRRMGHAQARSTTTPQ